MAHRVAPQAVADLDDISYYVAIDRGSAEIADKFIDNSVSHSGCSDKQVRSF
jgi:hypothetical protein